MKRRIAQLDEEGSLLDDRLEALQAACRAILELSFVGNYCYVTTNSPADVCSRAPGSPPLRSPPRALITQLRVSRHHITHAIDAHLVLATLRGMFSRLARQV